MGKGGKMVSPEHGRIPWSEFRAEINREVSAERVRNGIFAWLSGLGCIAFGLYGWTRWTDGLSLMEQAAILAVLATAWPLSLWLAALPVRALGRWPRCPACGEKLTAPLPTLATRRCPHCDAAILRDPRPAATGYRLPEHVKRSISTADIEAVPAMAAYLACPLFLTVLMANVWELAAGEMMREIVVVAGGMILFLSGILPFLAPKAGAVAVRCVSRFLRDRSRFCPECGRIPVAGVVRLSGCCSECGVRLIDPPPSGPEPPASPMLWRNLRRYRKFWRAYLAVSIAPAGVFLFAGPFLAYRLRFVAGWSMVGIFVLVQFFWLAFLNPRLCRRLGITLRCSGCRGKDKEMIDMLLHYRRCPCCLRKRVRDGEEES